MDDVLVKVTAYSEWALLNEDAGTHVAIQNMSFDPQGRCFKLTRGRLRRWWQARRGWTHYVGSHYGGS